MTVLSRMPPSRAGHRRSRFGHHRVPDDRPRAQAPVVIKFSHVVALDTPKGKGADKFKELAEARLKGRVKIEVYPNSTLYKDLEEVEALQLGSVHMLAPSLAKFGPLGAREFGGFDLPYIFENYEELHKAAARLDAGCDLI